MTLELLRGGRYGILRWLVRRATEEMLGWKGSAAPTWVTGAGKPAWQLVIDRLDVALDPILGDMLPIRSIRRALMVFRKAS